MREAAQGVRKYLEKARVDEVDTSRITIEQLVQYRGNEPQSLGYKAKVVFQVLLRQLDKLKDVIAGLADAGVDELSRVDFETTKLKEIRAEARRQAIIAAREKAENYCHAAGVALGKILHIEDVNPDELLYGVGGHVERGISEPKLFEPGRIAVSAAVIVAYKIEERSP